MRRIICLLLALVMCFSMAIAEEDLAVYHYPFGLSETLKPEEIAKNLELLFEDKMSDTGAIVPKYKELFGIPVYVITYYKPDNTGWHYLKITLKTDDIRAQDLARIIEELNSAYGEPSIAKMQKEEIDLSGKKVVDMKPEDLENIQKAWDNFNFDCLYTWDNVCLTAYSSTYSLDGITRESRHIELYYAFTYVSLPYKVQKYYSEAK